MRFKRVYIEITNICNMHCSFCPKLSRAPREMSAAEFEVIAEQVRKYSEYIYLHVKGEPLAHSEIDNILTICDKRGFKVNITTNGTLIENKLEILQKHKCIRQINISLHSMETADKAKIYINNIIRCAEVLATKMMVSLRIWTYDKGFYEVNNYMLELLENNFKKNIPLNNTRSELAENIFFSLGETFEWPSPLSDDISDIGYCLGTRSQLAILSNGAVVPCCLDAEGVVTFGNIFEKNLDDILQTERFLNMYNGLSGRKLTEKLCRKCSYRQRFD